MLLPACPTDVIYSLQYAWVDVAVVLRGRFAADIGGGRYQRLLETIAELFGKGLLRDADAQTAVLGNEVRSEVDGTVEDDGGGLRSDDRIVGHTL